MSSPTLTFSLPHATFNHLPLQTLFQRHTNQQHRVTTKELLCIFTMSCLLKTIWFEEDWETKTEGSKAPCRKDGTGLLDLCQREIFSSHVTLMN